MQHSFLRSTDKHAFSLSQRFALQDDLLQTYKAWGLGAKLLATPNAHVNMAFIRIVVERKDAFGQK